jgi:hypothetical protein
MWRRLWYRHGRRCCGCIAAQLKIATLTLQNVDSLGEGATIVGEKIHPFVGIGRTLANGHDSLNHRSTDFEGVLHLVGVVEAGDGYAGYR